MCSPPRRHQRNIPPTTCTSDNSTSDLGRKRRLGRAANAVVMAIRTSRMVVRPIPSDSHTVVLQSHSASSRLDVLRSPERSYIILYMRALQFQGGLWLTPNSVGRATLQLTPPVIGPYIFKTLLSTDHCLHPLLPPVKSNPHGHRPRDHNLQLPVCNYNFRRNSFIISSLYRFI